MKKIALLFLVLACLPSLAAAEVTGTVVNRTTGEPQAGATVTLYKFGQGGMEPVASTKTDAARRISASTQDRRRRRVPPCCGWKSTTSPTTT